MTDLRDFVADLMETEGAIVESVAPDGLDVMAPAPVRDALAWPELARLGFGADRPEGAMPIGLEGDWLDRFGALIGARGHFAARQLVLPDEVAPPTDAQRLIDRAITLPNAIWRFIDAGPAWTRLLLLTFRYTAMSDEKREGLIRLGLNCGTGAVLDDAALARYRLCLENGGEWQAPEPSVISAAGSAGNAGLLIAKARPLIEHLVQQELAPFMRAMRRRLDRDCGRLYGYHDDLRRSAQDKLLALQPASGDKAEAGIKRETMRIAAIEREYAAKLDDLRHNYALQVSVDLVQALTLYAPVHRYDLLIKRRKGERQIAMDWHPATRLMEPPPCDFGLAQERTRHVCDEHLHLTAPAAGPNCPTCAKPWCRACHRAACPRCKRAADRPQH